MPSRGKDLIQKYGILFILIFALFLRGMTITDKPLWYDEAFSVLFVESGISNMIEGTIGNQDSDSAAEEHPLGYYIILSGWISIFGNSPTTLRFLSIVFNLFTILIIYNLIKSLFSKNIALLGTFMIAVSPFQIHYAQEIRMYSLLALLIFAATISLFNGMKTQQTRWWILFAILSAAAQFTHNVAFIYLVPLACTPILFKDWQSLKKTIVSGMGAILLYLPWLLHIQKQLSKIQSNYWMDTPGIEKLFTTLLTLTANFPTFDSFYFVGFVLSMFLLVIGVIQTVFILKGKENSSYEGIWLTLMTFIPPLLLFLIAQSVPIYVERALLPTGIFFLIWVSWFIINGNLAINPRYFLITIVLVCAGTGILFNLKYRGFPYAPFRELALNINTELLPNTTIIHSNKLTILPMVYYQKDLPQVFIADIAGSRTDTFGQITQDIMGVKSFPSIETAAGESDIVLLIVFTKEIIEYENLGISPHPNLVWLSENYSSFTQSEWGELQVFTFEK